MSLDEREHEHEHESEADLTGERQPPPHGRQPGAPGPRSRLIDPRIPVPSGTTIRFAVLVIVLIASTASIFSYLWQVAEPAAQGPIGHCLTQLSGGTLGNLLNRSNNGSDAMHLALLLCLQPAQGSLNSWALAGVGLLALGTALEYLITPWWLRTVGSLGRPSRLVSVTKQNYPQETKNLASLVRRAGLDEEGVRVTFLADERTTGTDSRTFGGRRHACVRLEMGLLAGLRGELSGPGSAKFAEKVLHELGHVRNRDNLPTYLTYAAWHTFYLLTGVGYLWALIISGRAPAFPGLQTLLVLCALIALVSLSAHAVVHTREYHADATAAFFSPTGGLLLFKDTLPDKWPARVLSWFRFHPTNARRAAVLANEQRLFRPDAAAMAAAGIAVAVMVSAVNPAVFSAIAGSGLGGIILLISRSGSRALLTLLAEFGPAAVLAAALVSGLTCSVAWRWVHLRRAWPKESRLPFAGAAAALAAGMTVGFLLGIDNAVAGTWGVNDATATRDLLVLVSGFLVLCAILAVLSVWAVECAAVWSGGARGTAHARLAFAGAVAVGTVGFAPAFFAWVVVAPGPLSALWLPGPTEGERTLIGGWPLVRLLFFHPEALGVYDDVPGGAGALGLACLFVAAGAWTARRDKPAGTHGDGDESGATPRRRHSVGPFAIAATSALCAAAACGLGLALLLGIRAAVGGNVVTGGGGYGLQYITRSLQVFTALVAATGALLLTRRTQQARLSSALLTALIAATAAAPFAPQLLYIGYLGLHHHAVNPVNGPILFALFGHSAVAWALVATAFGLVAARAGVSVSRALRSRGAPRNPELDHEGQREPKRARWSDRPRIPARLWIAMQALGALSIAGAFVTLAQIGYYFATRDFNAPG